MLARQKSLNPHIGIVGAGLVGRLLAWQCLRRGHAVTLIERDALTAPRSCGRTAAAMIAPLSEVVGAETMLYHWGMQSLQIWPEWIATLNDSVPNSTQYAAPGTLVIAHPQDANSLLQFKQDLNQRLGNNDNSQWLTKTELIAREGALENFSSALYLPAEAYLHQRQLLDNLLWAIRQLGGHCIDQCPANIVDQHLDYAGQRVQFDAILDSRGMGAGADLAQLRGVRGEVLWVETRELNFQHPIRLMHPRYKIYLVPKGAGRYMIGATEIESNDASPISLQSTLELGSALYTIHPALAEARIIESDTNVRPALPDNLPKVERHGCVIRVNGLYRHGYLLAPVVLGQALEFLDDILNNRNDSRLTNL